MVEVGHETENGDETKQRGGAATVVASDDRLRDRKGKAPAAGLHCTGHSRDYHPTKLLRIPIRSCF